MNETKISTSQLFCVMFLLMLGDAVLTDIGKEAVKDAWLVVLMGTVTAVFLYLLFLRLSKHFPNLILTEQAEVVWGKYIGRLIALIYIVYFIYVAAIVLRRFCEILIMTSYLNTTPFTLGILMILCISYGLIKGIHIVARASILLFVIIGLTYFLLTSFELFDGIIHPQNVLPVLEEGWGPVFHAYFPGIVATPFGNVFLIIMLFPLLKEKAEAKKAGVFFIICSGLFITLVVFNHLSILGACVVDKTPFPILTAVSIVNIAHFIARLEALVVTSMIILGFVKAGIFFYCAVIACQKLFKMNSEKKLVLPIGFIILFISVAVTPSYNELVYETSRITPYLLSLPLKIGIPLLLLGTVYIKNRLRRVPNIG